MSRPRAKILMLGSFALCGCAAIGPDYTPPQLDTATDWQASNEDRFTADSPTSLANWWVSLNDPTLDGLIDQALAANLDLASAVQRVRQAAAVRGVSAGQRFPDLDATGSYSRDRQGSNGFPAMLEPAEFESFALGMEFGWELDVWGRVRRVVEAADADLQASIEDLRDVRAILIAEVANEYVLLRTAQARFEVATRNIEIQRQSLELTRTRFDNGAAPRLDVAQAETNLANTEAELPSIATDIRDGLLRLAVLLGEQPTILLEGTLGFGMIPGAPDLIAVGIPADIVRRRPDIRSAERQLAAEVASIGVELGDLYPRFTLGGSLEFNSTNSGSLFDADSVGHGFGPSFSWNLFDGGRERSEVRAQEAAADIALLGYRQTVLEALEEVESAMYGHARQIERAAALTRASDAARASADLSKQLYLEGRSDFQNVLDSERELFTAEDNLILSTAEVTTSYIALQRALGGGWDPTSPQDDDPPEPSEDSGASSE
ncbi:MAG: efflux transporter outer membrane subunit [Planctomycetota bacterium]